MSIGIEHLTSNTQVAYPFREDASGLARGVDSTHGNLALFPLDAVVDAVALGPTDIETLYLTSITLDSGTVFQFVFKDEDDATIIDGVLDTSSLDSAKTFNTFTITNTDTTIVYQIRMVVLTAPFLAYLAGCTADTFGATLPFEDRTVEQRRRKIETLEVYASLPVTPAPTTPGNITGAVKFLGGYNTEYAPEVDADAADTTDITIDLAAGGGLGRYPCLDDTSAVYHRFMGLVPDNGGNILIVGGEDTCYTIVPAAGTFQIHGACVACCSCEDYANVLKALRYALNHAQLTLQKLNEAYDTYQQGVIDFNNGISERFIGPKLGASGWGGILTTMPVDPTGTKMGSDKWATISMDVQNNTGSTLTLTHITMTFTTPTAYRVVGIHWSYGDPVAGLLGGALTDLTDPSVATLPSPVMGTRLAFGIICEALASAGYDPTWDGSITIEGTLQPPTGSPEPFTVTKTLVFT